MSLKWRTIILVFLSITLILSIYATHHFHSLPDKEVNFMQEFEYVHEAEYRYNITLWPSILYDNRTVLMPNEVPFIPLVHLLNVSFTYYFMSKPIVNGDITYQVTCFLESPAGWRKIIVLVPPTLIHFNSTPVRFSKLYIFNITEIVELINAIEDETRTYAPIYYLRIQPCINITASTGSRIVNESFKPQMVVKLMFGENNHLVFEGLKHKKENVLGKYVTTEVTWIKQARYAMYTFTGIILISIVYVAQQIWKERKSISPIEKAMKKYRDIIVDAVGLSGERGDKSVVMVRSLDDLAKVSDEVVKPIIHVKKPGLHVFYVLDDDIRYEFIIKEG
ncbi:MAG: hypothetical protein DRJ38_00790 [Thermoprotei archaeon]|nr:MAG: hypothetical protein DRJ38_00790 [Thermoprotei archaeon]